MAGGSEPVPGSTRGDDSPKSGWIAGRRSTESRHGKRSGSDARPLLSVRTAMALHFLRRMGPPIFGVVLYDFIASLILRWDIRRCAESPPDFGESLYAVYTQLFFQQSMPLPHAPIARTIFWLSPLVGAVLIAEGILKIGAELFSADARHRLWVRVVTERMRDHVVVCGLGHVGYRVVEELQRLGEPIVAIERKGTDSFVETVKGMGIPVFIADVRRDEVLIAAGMADAKAVVCATDNDLVNLEVAIDSKRMNPEVRVVMRMFDQRLASKIGSALDVDRTFSTSALSATLVALQATQKGIRAAYRLDDGTTRVAVELVVGSDFDPTRVDELEEKVDARVISVRHKSKTGFADVKRTTTLLAGDVVIIDAKVGDLAWVRRALHGTFHDPPLDLPSPNHTNS
jgi:voltage-gated potassium channel